MDEQRQETTGVMIPGIPTHNIKGQDCIGQGYNCFRWWLRSPNSNNSNNAARVSPNGNVENNNVNNKIGARPALPYQSDVILR